MRWGVRVPPRDGAGALDDVADGSGTTGKRRIIVDSETDGGGCVVTVSFADGNESSRSDDRADDFAWYGVDGY